MLHLTPAAHDADPPASWQVSRNAAGRWELRSSAHQPWEEPLGYYQTREAAEEDKVSGPYVRLYEKEGRWFRGEPVYGWKPYVPGGPLR